MNSILPNSLLWNMYNCHHFWNISVIRIANFLKKKKSYMEPSQDILVIYKWVIFHGKYYMLNGILNVLCLQIENIINSNVRPTFTYVPYGDRPSILFIHRKMD